MNWIKKLFKKKEVVPKKEIKFSIEYYPLTGKHFPKYGENYLSKYEITGIVEVKKPYLFPYVTSFRKMESALALINLYKEQRLKENVKIIEL